MYDRTLAKLEAESFNDGPASVCKRNYQRKSYFVPKILFKKKKSKKGARSSSHISQLIWHTAGELAIPRARSIHILLTRTWSWSIIRFHLWGNHAWTCFKRRIKIRIARKKNFVHRKRNKFKEGCYTQGRDAGNQC